MKKQSMKEEETKSLKDMVVENFCEPVKSPKKEECERFYDEWEKKSETEG